MGPSIKEETIEKYNALSKLKFYFTIYTDTDLATQINSILVFFKSPDRDNIFISSPKRPCRGPIQPPIKWVPWPLPATQKWAQS
jgi:hypothetical protein